MAPYPAAIASRRGKLPGDAEILGAVVALVDDGFCPVRQLAVALTGVGERELRRALKRAVRRGLLLERKGPDGTGYVALTSDGWQLHRDAADQP